MGYRSHCDKPWKGRYNHAAQLLILAFFSTKDQRPILDDDLRLNVENNEIEYDES